MMSYSCDLAQRPTMDKEFRGGGGLWGNSESIVALLLYIIYKS